MKTIRYSIYVLFIAVAAGCGRGDGDFDASGTFESTEVIVSSQASGEIMAFDVLEGDVFTAGQMVGYVDSVQLYLKKRQLEATIRASESRRPEINKQIAATMQQIETAKFERERVRRLLQSQAANQKQLDDADAEVAVLEKQLVAQRSNLDNTDKGISDDVAALNYQVLQAADQIEKCRIINPVAGTVLTKFAERGEVLTPGRSLYKIADTKNMFLRAYILSGQVTALKIGQRVKVYADKGDKDYREYDGTVSWISDKAEFTPKTIQTKDERENLVYAVKIAVVNDGFIKIGMYGEVNFNSTQP